MELPAPNTEGFYKLGPKARKISRWRHNSEPIRPVQKKKSEAQKSIMEVA